AAIRDAQPERRRGRGRELRERPGALVRGRAPRVRGAGGGGRSRAAGSGRRLQDLRVARELAAGGGEQLLDAGVDPGTQLAHGGSVLLTGKRVRMSAVGGREALL